MDKPSPKAIVEATGISQPYASMILAEDETKRRTPPRPLAIAIFRKLGWRHETIADLTEQQMAVLEEIEPWQAPQERAA